MKTKAEILAALVAAGVQGVDESMTVENLKAIAAEKGVSLEKPKPEKRPLVTVRVTGQPVGEDHGNYAKGETFETTAERAEALGPLVEIVDAK